MITWFLTHHLTATLCNQITQIEFVLLTLQRTIKFSVTKVQEMLFIPKGVSGLNTWMLFLFRVHVIILMNFLTEHWSVRRQASTLCIKGPFTSSDCDASAMTRRSRSQINYRDYALYCYIQCLHLCLWLWLNYLLLGDRFVTDSRATSLRFWSRIAIASQSLYVKGL